MDSKEEICPVCGNTSYENQDGHYYCLECGTQSQVMHDEMTEDDPTSIIMYNKLRVRKVPKRSLEDEEDCTLSLYESWQFIYKLYMDRISKEKFCEKDIEACAKLLWFMFLKYLFYNQLSAFNKVDTMEKSCISSSSNISFKSLYRVILKGRRTRGTPKKKREQQEEVEGEDSDEDYYDLSLTDDSSKLDRLFQKSFKIMRNKHAFISKRTLVALLYFSLLYSNNYLPLNDFINLVYEDVIPYYSWHLVLPKALTKRMLTYQRRRIAENHSPLFPKEFSRSLSHVKTSLALQFLPLDVMKMATVLLKKLLLPDSLLTPLKRLLYLYQETTLPNMGPYVLIDVGVIINIIILMKLVYRLDDNYERVQGEQSVSSSEDFDKSKYTYVWEDWVAMVTRERYNKIQTDIKPSQNDLVHLDDMSCYMKSCKEKYFGMFNLDVNTGQLRQGEKGGHFKSLFGNFVAKRRERRRREEATATASVTNKRQLFITIGDRVHTVAEAVVPRWIPLDLNLESLGRSSRLYQPVMIDRSNVLPLEQLSLSQSEQFLIDHCSRTINVPVNILLDRLRVAEAHLTDLLMKSNENINMYMKCKEKTERE
ncbi:PREDICTED: TATA box-binding protein-associated factor RNA polymerase I subunit B-like [Amphimedon queenslandica]|uniref:TATA box-binding protein-associated factor RNA polymerase I subunit B n=1 Tax=Amphimedon queenslandica TaxID=400682 RepID=A0A1X7VK71_AMPQE|nr:PREDICTED: TATA box-binding protein-associated factor RNA polymerase I subunit B-like [Amphimedon queenslandica]|eukprot:XP_019864426.1 PREDICTED: TATA box-binding protein-associated factor RNA polymerase I subunit B-like [Amphimedon queenslandica]